MGEILDKQLLSGLLEAGLQHERRPLRLQVHDLHADTAADGDLMIEFRLDRGGYATSVLRELVKFSLPLETGITTE